MDLSNYESIYDGGYFWIACRTLSSGYKMYNLVTEDQRAVQSTVAINISHEEALQIVMSDGDKNVVGRIISDPAAITSVEKKLMDLGYTKDQASAAITNYDTITTSATHLEWSATDGSSVIDAAATYSPKANTKTGTFGNAAKWEDLNGGAVQMTTKLDGDTMIKLGIISDVTDGIKINAV